MLAFGCLFWFSGPTGAFDSLCTGKSQRKALCPPVGRLDQISQLVVVRAGPRPEIAVLSADLSADSLDHHDSGVDYTRVYLAQLNSRRTLRPPPYREPPMPGSPQNSEKIVR